MLLDQVPGSVAPRTVTDVQLLDHICHYICARGFTFPREVVAYFYVALKTKPFAILTGMSGTGKTKLTQLFADALTGRRFEHYLLTPVAPN